MNSIALGNVAFNPGSGAAIAHAITNHDKSAPLLLGFVNPHVVTVAHENSDVADFLASCRYVCVDGIGVSLALRLKRVLVERLPAHKLLDDLLDTGTLKGNLVVLGIESGQVVNAANAIAKRSRSVNLMASLDGFASDDLAQQFLEANKHADVVLIGAGSPRSEFLANLAAQTCSHAVVFHCGAGSLGVYAGTRVHAAKWISNIGLDWFYRFVREPHTRQRYTLGLVKFLRYTQ